MAIIKEVTTVASIAMPIEERWTIRRCRYASDADNKGRLCISTGMHGDELLGQLIVFGVARRIQESPDALHGVVDIYPMLNPLGLDVTERMIPQSNMLDMNRAFPGTKDGTALEAVCYAVYEDMLGADLVLDIHTSARFKSELYEVRINARDVSRMMAHARALCPEMIWVHPDKVGYSASLTSTLCEAGTPALMLEVDERRRHPQEVADRVVEGIFCKMKAMGLWSGQAVLPPTGEIPTVQTMEDVCRVACETAGVFVPVERMGQRVQRGELLGTVIDAMEGVVREEIKAPVGGLVFSQRSYSSVYPGTLIARLCRKEHA